MYLLFQFLVPVAECLVDRILLLAARLRVKVIRLSLSFGIWSNKYSDGCNIKEDARPYRGLDPSKSHWYSTRRSRVLLVPGQQSRGIC